MYEKGKGVETDKKQADIFYEEAASLGSVKARQALKRKAMLNNMPNTIAGYIENIFQTKIH